MASIIVLIRHGKAVSANSEIEDLARPLTAFGKRALMASLPDSLLPLAYMPEFTQGETQVWSSGAFRAMETAEIASSILGVSEIQEHMCLLAQDFDEFMTEAYNCEADVVVAVGHEPFTSQAADRLCGVALPFKTGAVAIFDISGYQGEPCDSALRHFAQGPRTERWKALVGMEDVLSQSVENVKSNMQLFIDNPKDVEALHDFRISIRTLRANLSFIKPYTDKKQVKEIQANLRDLVTKTSYLRELDVFSQIVQDSPNCNDELLAAVAKLRKKECRKLLEAINEKGTRKQLRKALKQVGQLEWKNHIEALGLSKEDVTERFELFSLTFEAAYLQTDYADVDATHDLRKLAKRVRYASRDFGSIIGDDALQMAKAMKDVQERLGDLCDARVNCEIIDALPRKKFSDAADTAVAAIKQEQIDFIMAVLEEEAAEDEVIGDDVQFDVMDADLPEAIEEAVEEITVDSDAAVEEAVENDELESYVEDASEADQADQAAAVDISDFIGESAPVGDED